MINKLITRIHNLSPKLRQIIKNISWLFADRILRMGIGVIVVAWIARYLGLQQFGSFNYAMAFVALFYTFARLGLDRIVVRDIINNPSDKEEILGTAFALKLIGGLIAWFLTIGTLILVRPNDMISQWLVGIIAAGTIFEAFDTIDFWFQVKVQSKYTVLARNIVFIIMTGIRIILISIKAPLITFAWAIFLENLLGAVGLTIAYQVNGQNLKVWRVRWQRAKCLLKESWSLVVAGVAIMIYLRIDQVMLGQLADDRAVGIYSVTTRLSEIWYFIPIAIVSSVAPAITEAKQVSETIYYKKLQKLFNLMALLAYSIAIPMTFFARNIMTIVFGQEYGSGSGVLSIQVWTGLFCFFGVAKSQIWIINEGRTTYNLVEKCTGAVMNILLNLWLIPSYKEMGAAIATLISYAWADYFMCLLYPPARRIGWAMTKAMILNAFWHRRIDV
ncbi:MAG TPA: flippase [Cyanobacteria bacterium UBA11149]|nr:flippase [Cyanobacteria bacterium UBA11367]HBE60940.1 flippase [Cyanobacteria bacterium UBA11366]HBR76402.1 flippase [Cyanobacteria bacterium UBA11159]HBS72057.1 flippase [Cyanobacteria bacterium UBA11153]HBW89752.1 flippase [Cyanobacteria bacterium UBA11149]HCA95470.1 flippase [Cyanobacteria bacterium UBA9226]